jgi:DNA-binding FadR family transcriptional regulator
MPGTAVDELGAVIAAMAELANRGEDFADEDRRFHQVLFEPLGNQTLLKLLDVFWLTYREASRHMDMGNPDPISTYQDHAAIYEAVAATDVAEARTALDRHYAGIAGRLAQAQALFHERREVEES